jgi:hypothetical protein
MRRALVALSLSGPLLAGATFVVLYPILGVALWIAFIAAGGVLLADGFAVSAKLARRARVGAAGSDRGTGQSAVRINPIVRVTVLRVRFFVSLALALAGGFMVVETFAFSTSTATAISFALGIAVVTVAVAFYIGRLGSPKQVVWLFRGRVRVPAWDALALLVGTIGAWNIVQTQVFADATSRWLTFADGLGLLGLTLAALVLHELSTERVVHALEVVRSAADGDAEQAAEADREAAQAA